MGAKPTYQELERRVRELEAGQTGRPAGETHPLETNERYRLLAETMSDIIWTADMDLRFTYVSPSVDRLIGYKPEELVGRSVLDHLTETASETAAAKFIEALAAREAGPGSTVVVELERRDRHGAIVHGEVAFAFLRDAEGKPAGIIGITRDITRQKQAELALRESEERFRTLYEDSPISLWEEDYSEVRRFLTALRDQGGVVDFRTYLQEHPEAVAACASRVRVIDVNQATLKVFEAESKEDFLAGLDRVFTRESYSVFREGLIALAEGKTSFESEAVNRTLRGREIDIALRWSVPKQYEQTLARLLVSIVDLSARKRMEKELAKIQRLESLAILAGGIAHDFNNILTPILTNLSMVKAFGELRDDVAKMLTDAETASLRARQLTQQLLTFAKGGKPAKKPLPVANLLVEVVEFALSGSKARGDFLLPNDLWLVEADEGQISQVVQNLVINADQAMPRGGIIRVRAENVVIRKRDALPLRSGRHLKISISDEGAGIAPKHLPSIFDPFFTTKQKGSGLGLTTAFSIVRNHDGHIGVDSELGVGTTFHVYLPATDRASPEAARGEDRPVRAEGRVLVIDDDESIRRSAAEVLKRVGYQTEVAQDHLEGIQRYTEAMARGQPFDAVIMDLTIRGGMEGKEAIRKLKGIDPNLKAIASSGYSDDPVMSHYQDYGFSGVVPKPYRIEELTAEIRRVLKG